VKYFGTGILTSFMCRKSTWNAEGLLVND